MGQLKAHGSATEGRAPLTVPRVAVPQGVRTGTSQQLEKQLISEAPFPTWPCPSSMSYCQSHIHGQAAAQAPLPCLWPLHPVLSTASSLHQPLQKLLEGFQNGDGAGWAEGLLSPLVHEFHSPSL